MDRLGVRHSNQADEWGESGLATLLQPFVLPSVCRPPPGLYWEADAWAGYHQYLRAA